MPRPNRQYRRYRPRSPRPYRGLWLPAQYSSSGFGKLVLSLSALTFLGVYGLLTPEARPALARVANNPASLFSSMAGDATSRADADDSYGTYYRNCDAARAAGAAPLHAGESGYRSGLDRDGDGVACEPYRGR